MLTRASLGPGIRCARALVIWSGLIAIAMATAFAQNAEKISVPKGNYMTTKETIEGYFDSLKQKKDWQSFLADDMVFTSFTSPVKQVVGKAGYLEIHETLLRRDCRFRGAGSDHRWRQGLRSDSIPTPAP